MRPNPLGIPCGPTVPDQRTTPDVVMAWLEREAGKLLNRADTTFPRPIESMKRGNQYATLYKLWQQAKQEAKYV